MKHTLVLVFLLANYAYLNAQTVQSAVNAVGCSTTAVAGLSKQLVSQTNELQPGLFTDLRGLRGASLSAAVQAVPYIQTSAFNALQRVITTGGRTLSINSALRTLPQQLLLRKWYEMRACGIPDAATPGRSNHNGGLAVDVNDPWGWAGSFAAHSFTHLGRSDPPHFDYRGSGATDVRSLSVRAFQVLWNKNNPSDRISEDGVYGQEVESRLLRSPANGFPIGPSAGSGTGTVSCSSSCAVCIDSNGGIPCASRCTGCGDTCLSCVRNAGGDGCFSRCGGVRPATTSSRPATTAAGGGPISGATAAGGGPISGATTSAVPKPGNSCPAACKTCIDSNGGAPCGVRCSGCTSNCISCVTSNGGRACASKCAPSPSMLVTPAQFSCMFPAVSSAKVSEYIPYLNAALVKYGITSTARVRMFMAQTGHETASYATFVEYTNADGTNAWCGNYEGGCTYRGRGAIQLTHRSNYARAGKELGQDFVGNPGLVAQTRYAFEAGGLFWKWNSDRLNPCSDSANVQACTRVINGGQNGIDDRLRLYEKAKQCIPATPARAAASEQNSFGTSAISGENSSAPVVAVIVVGSIVVAVLAAMIVLLTRKLQSFEESLQY